MLPALERRFDVFAPTLPGHAGGPPLGELGETVMVDAVERALDEAGIETAHVAGNSLGGFVALQLAARGRARSVVGARAGGRLGARTTPRTARCSGSSSACTSWRSRRRRSWTSSSPTTTSAARRPS